MPVMLPAARNNVPLQMIGTLYIAGDGAGWAEKYTLGRTANRSNADRLGELHRRLQSDLQCEIVASRRQLFVDLGESHLQFACLASAIRRRHFSRF